MRRRKDSQKQILAIFMVTPFAELRNGLLDVQDCLSLVRSTDCLSYSEDKKLL